MLALVVARFFQQTVKKSAHATDHALVMHGLVGTFVPYALRWLPGSNDN